MEMAERLLKLRRDAGYSQDRQQNCWESHGRQSQNGKVVRGSPTLTI